MGLSSLPIINWVVLLRPFLKICGSSGITIDGWKLITLTSQVQASCSQSSCTTVRITFQVNFVNFLVLFTMINYYQMVIFNNMINGSSVGAVAITIISNIKEFVIIKKKITKNALRVTQYNMVNRLLKYSIIYLLILQYDNSTSSHSTKNAIFFLLFRVCNLVVYAQYYYSRLGHTSSYLKEEMSQYSDLLSVLSFDDLKNSPLTEKFNKR